MKQIYTYTVIIGMLLSSGSMANTNNINFDAMREFLKARLSDTSLLDTNTPDQAVSSETNDLYDVDYSAMRKSLKERMNADRQ
jgi:hypothetical protein